jgi:catechol 2,3-dioxygenase-like lactoylglutathione lyase family enzyme
VVRVAHLLAEWGADERVEASGLCHACYSTDGYGRALRAISERSLLAELIGEEAESLVYLYGSCDRVAVYPTLAGSTPVRFRDRFTGEILAPVERDIRAFVELTAANELDVIRHNPVVAAKHGEELFELVRRTRPRVSDAAWEAWEGELRNLRAAQPELPAVSISGLDHLVLTVADLAQAISFYERVLGMRPVTFDGGRHALAFGTSKINLHQAGHEIEPHALRPAPGSADLCLVTAAPPQQILEHLGALQVSVEEGPVLRTGARGAITSVYVRDPDGNLIEIACYDAHPASDAE